MDRFFKSKVYICHYDQASTAQEEGKKNQKKKPVCLEVMMKFNLETFTVLSMLNHWKLEIKKNLKS